MALIVSTVFFLAIIGQTFGGVDFQECYKETTYGREYITFFPVNFAKRPPDLKSITAFYLEFHVKTARDAHILLSPTEEKGGYEILLGGGNNTFSQIRLIRHKRTYTKMSNETNDIVSSTEYRGFWLKLETMGFIMVGKLGEEIPFLHWLDNKPFEVSFFAFSSWTNVMATWYFNCLPKPKQENISSTQLLKKDLLTFYNPYNYPERDGDPRQSVELHLDVNHFSLDEARGELVLNGISYLKWMDWKLRWDSSHYGGISAIHLPMYQIWTPNIRVINALSLDKKSLLSLAGRTTVRNNGEVSWRVPFHSLTICELGYKTWPFDNHVCTLVFGFLTEPLSIEIPIVDISKIIKSYWRVERMISYNSTIESDAGEKFEVNSCGIDIHFRRNDGSFQYLLIPPFLVGAVLCLLSFWVSPNSLTKFFFNCVSLMVLTFANIAMNERFPRKLSSTPKIVGLYTWGTILICIPIILFVGLKYFPATIRLPKFTTYPLNIRITEILCCFPEKMNKKIGVDHRGETENFISTYRLALLIERIVFVIFLIIFIVVYQWCTEH